MVYGKGISRFFPLKNLMKELKRQEKEIKRQRKQVDFRKKDVYNKYGEIFLKHVRESLHILNTGIKRTKQAAKVFDGNISIGYIHTQGRNFIPKLVRALP